MAHSVMKLICPLCGDLNAVVTIEGDVTRKVRADVLELIFQAHVRDYHPVGQPSKRDVRQLAALQKAGAR